MLLRDLLLTTCCLVVVIAGKLAGIHGKPPRIGEEQKLLQGRWKLVAFECKGKSFPVNGDYFIVIANPTITWSPWMTTKPEKGRPFKFVYSIDPSTKPKSLILNRTLPSSRFGEEEMIKWMHGYKVEKDSLHLVYDAAEGKLAELPNSFNSKEGVLRVVAKYKRAN